MQRYSAKALLFRASGAEGSNCRFVFRREPSLNHCSLKTLACRAPFLRVLSLNRPKALGRRGTDEDAHQAQLRRSDSRAPSRRSTFYPCPRSRPDPRSQSGDVHECLTSEATWLIHAQLPVAPTAGGSSRGMDHASIADKKGRPGSTGRAESCSPLGAGRERRRAHAPGMIIPRSSHSSLPTKSDQRPSASMAGAAGAAVSSSGAAAPPHYGAARRQQAAQSSAVLNGWKAAGQEALQSTSTCSSTLVHVPSLVMEKSSIGGTPRWERHWLRKRSSPHASQSSSSLHLDAPS
ncbi:unnamed protein product [Prorocentrum cordatum]|uniref:Uncharacterized protein n=1 Tax=Prorocentrum cordatum TaxID=2364126 RepID=A0ABN9XCS8_9DINO|nr:unnamed protein product [Polarella glacialis]